MTFRGVRWAAVAVLAVAGAGAAEPPELVTDRPDATESSAVVTPGRAQAELGWTRAEDGGGRSDELQQTLLRFGVAERLELRLGWSGYLDATGGEGDGAGDGEIGTKVYLWGERGAVPEAALLASLSLPWGDKDVSSRESDPGFRFSMSHTLSDRVSLGYNLGAEWATEDGSTLGSFVYTAALGFGLTDTIGAYIEVFGDMGMNAPGDAHSLDGGFTFLLRPNLQIDVLAGVGLNGEADDWFAGAGVSCRFPD